MDIRGSYERWLSKATDDSDLITELNGIKDDEKEIYERFYRAVEFGTGGLRGIIGAGVNRMNIYTIRQATQGLADYLNEKYDNPSAVVGYDSRIKSDLFAKETAKTLAANGIKTYLFSHLIPTPLLSFAVRRLKCSAGVIVTASHNPSKYNGYKCYGEEGFQMTDANANIVFDMIQNVDIFDGVKLIDFDEAIDSGAISYVEPWLMEEFLDRVEETGINPGVCQKADLNIIYTPLNGAGNKPVREILSRIGVEKLTIVKEQENPDGNFTTCPFPNPEIKQVFEIALEMAKKSNPDLLLATDPDCDRVGIAVNHQGEFHLMSGNEVGALMLEYILSQRKEKGTLPIAPIAVKTIVTSELATIIAQKYGCEICDLLTGFKYIGELMTSLQRKGELGRYVLGFEESYGYLSGFHARDKDAVNASMLIAEMAAFYKLQGKTLVDVMNEIYDEFGYYINTVNNFTCEGAEGMERMSKIMSDLRSNIPEEIAGKNVVSYSDYLESKFIDLKSGQSEAIDLPKSNVLSFKLEGDSIAIIRPSGTEPKIKLYITSKAKAKEEAAKIGQDIAASVEKLMGF